MHSLNELLKEQLKDLFDAEIQFSAMLPDMIERATSTDLRQGLSDISESTVENISQLQEACQLLETPPTGVTCEAMRGLIREVAQTTDGKGDTATTDASLIANAQRIAHYEIAGFGTAKAFAKCLGENDVAALLGKLASRAGDHDKMLSYIATGGWFSTGVNQEAIEGSTSH
jgi:ferritin-like metal-binding protein YciE